MMTGRGGFREAQMVTQEYIDQFKPPENDSDNDRKKKKIKSEISTKKIRPQKEKFVAEEEKILLSVHNEKITKLQQKIDKLEIKEETTRKENKTLKSELLKTQKSYNNEKTKRETLDNNYKILHDNYVQIDKELKILRKTGGNTSEEIIAKNKELEDLYKLIKKKDKELSSLNTRISEIENEKESLINEIQELKKVDNNKTESPQEDNVNIITRITGTKFQSKLFISTRYKVSLSRDCSHMTFKVDLMGSATCIDSIIELPTIIKYLPFSGEKDYPIEFTNGNEMLIHL